MMKMLHLTLVLMATYLAAWTASYLATFVSWGDGLNFAHFFEYLRLAWSFSGGELPTFIWLLSLVIFVPLAGLAIWLLKRQARPQQHS